jgi:hypothetical protein
VTTVSDTGMTSAVLAVFADVPDRWAGEVRDVLTDAGRLALRCNDDAARLATVTSWLVFAAYVAERQGRDELAGWLSSAANAAVVECGLLHAERLNPPATPFL